MVVERRGWPRRARWLAAVLLAALLVGPLPPADTRALADQGAPRRSGVRTAGPEGGRPAAPRSRAQTPRASVPSPNVDASGDPRTQNEPSIAVDPSASNRVVIGANDYRNGVDSAVWAYSSATGGLSWAQVEIVDPVPGRHFNVSADAFPTRGDPGAAWDRAGNVYMSFIAFNRDNDADGGLFVAKSTDGGMTWPQVTMAQTNNSFELSDKPYIAVDQTTQPSGGNVYVSWTKFTGSVSQIFLSRSTDGGVTFTTSPDPLSRCKASHGSMPAVGPRGELYVVWEEFGDSAGCGKLIRGVKSTDGGVAFGKPFKVGKVREIPDPLPNTFFRTNSFPSLAVSPLDGSAYVTWADDRAGNADILIARSVNGRGWRKPRRVNDDKTNHAQFFPSVAVAPNGHLGVLFMDRRDDPQDRLMNAYLAVSMDQGQHFQPNVRLSDVSSDPNIVVLNDFIGDYVTLAAFAGGLHASWIDTRTVNQEIFTARTTLAARPL